MSLHDTWPGSIRREPAWSAPTYATLKPLSLWLQSEARRAHEDRGAYRVLDVGCGVKPYYPFFEPFASAYVGVDVAGNPAADLEGSIEELPVEDASFDVILCTQVLEHCDDPAQGVRELRRALAPGGRVLASTHGVQVYHPAPNDYWRWTHTGLERLFRTNAEWREVVVQPASGTTACLALLVNTYVDIVAKNLHVRPLARPLMLALNRAAAAIDARSSSLRSTRPGSLHANYHVVAEAPA